MSKLWIALRLSAMLLTSLILVSCAGKLAENSKLQLIDPDYVRTPPPVVMPEYGGVDLAEMNDGMSSAQIDLTNISKGYVIVTCNSPERAKFQVMNNGNGNTYYYDLGNVGEQEVFSLAMGSGYYSFNVFIKTVGGAEDEYTYFLSAERDVQLENDFVPFLIPNKLVSYTPDSNAVTLSYEIAEHASNDLEVVRLVYQWVQYNIKYDTDKALAVQRATEYLPDLDQFLVDKKGICYDYASLVAAMLRANAIPCQLVMGTVDTGQGQQVPHAWNLIWIEDEGWITVEIPSTPDAWERIDLTMASSNDPSIAQFIGDGSNYAQMSTH